jgi:hypothetical protein
MSIISIAGSHPSLQTEHTQNKRKHTLFFPVSIQSVLTNVFDVRFQGSKLHKHMQPVKEKKIEDVCAN